MEALIVVSAMKEEMQPLRELLSKREDLCNVITNPKLTDLDITIQASKEKHIITLTTGIGPENASKTIRRVLDFAEEQGYYIKVINIGACAGVTKDLKVFDIVQPALTLSPEEDPLLVCGEELKLGEYYRAVMCSGDFFLDSEEKKLSLWDLVDTYDMETHYFNMECESRGITFNAIRFISDNGTEEWEEVFNKNLPVGSSKIANMLIEII